MNVQQNPTPASKRLLSLDFMRGFIMVFLALESTWLYEELSRASEENFMHGFVRQFFHHAWHGLHFWDLIQPGFMYLAGISLALSLNKQAVSGMSWSDSFKKTLKRCFWLFFWGVLNYAVHPDGLKLELSNVLTQLSFTTLVAFLIFRWSFAAQVAVCAGLLLLREALYRYTNIPGFDHGRADEIGPYFRNDQRNHFIALHFCIGMGTVLFSIQKKDILQTVNLIKIVRLQ